MDKKAVQRHVALDIQAALDEYFSDYGDYRGIYVSPDGEMSFAHMGRQVIVKIVAAR